MDVIYGIPFWVWVVLLWDAVWKLLGLWRSARNDSPVWFILIAVLNTAGILPIIYLLTHRKKNVVSV